MNNDLNPAAEIAVAHTDAPAMETGGHSSRVEFAAELVSNLCLCPRDLLVLGAALLCSVAETANESFRESPFAHIDTSVNEADCNTVFRIAKETLEEVMEWHNGGATIPDERCKPSARFKELHPEAARDPAPEVAPDARG